ncbi:MAG: hypothetical protein ACRELV_04110 [Longimicrobiales bacterium]
MDVIGILNHDTSSIFPLLKGCDGYFTPPSVKDTSGCPQRNIREFALGLAYPAVDGTEWAVRLMTVAYSPVGRGIRVYELFFTLNGTDWIFRRETLLYFFE